MHIGLGVKYLLLLSGFDETSNSTRDFLKSNHYQMP